MRGSRPFVVLAVAVLALVAASAASARLPARASLRATTPHGGTLVLKVRRHYVVLMSGHQPKGRHDTCAAGTSGRMVFRIPNHDPLGDGAFKIDARQVLVLRNGGTRRSRLKIEGRLDRTGRHGSGRLRLLITDPGGRCDTGSVRWRIR